MGLLTRLSGVLFTSSAGTFESLGVEVMQSKEDFNRCLSESETRPVFIYKHSTVCPISRMAADCVADYLRQANGDPPPVFMVKVIESRPVSNEIAEKLGVRHESPQMILLKDRKPLWSVSHSQIEPRALAKAVQDLG